MKVFRKKRLGIITFISIIFLVTINLQCYGKDLKKLLHPPETHSEKNDRNYPDARDNDSRRDYENFKLTSGTYSEKDDLNRAVVREFGMEVSIADWNDLKAIPDIDAWISFMRLRNDQTFMVTVNGKYIFSGNRQYFVYYSTTGRPPAGFLVHEQISDKLFLGSWFGEYRKILVINKGGRRDSNYKLTVRNYSEKDNLDRAVARELGDDFAVADWNDLKAIPDLNAWISDMRLRNEQSFFVTRDGKFIHSGNRQYNVQYFALGNVPANYLIHDQIGHKLFLGSWFDLNEPILAIKKGNRIPPPIVREPQDYGFLKLTDYKFSETQNLERVVQKEFAGKCQVADWTDLKALPDIDAWISRRNLKRGQTFFVTRNGKFTFSGNRQYFVYYSPTGLLPRGFLVHEQIGHKLFLGSWYGEQRQILVRDYRNKPF